MTGATGGFLYVPGMTGAPSSASGPTGYTGTVAHVFDVSNNMPWYLNSVNTFGGLTGATPSWVAGNGQVLIQKIVLSGATGTVTLSAIPQVFNHLKIIVQGRTDDATTGVNLNMRFNGDAGTNYDYESGGGFNNTTVGSQNRAVSAISCGVIPAATATANVAGQVVIDIAMYNRTVFFKNVTVTSGSISLTGNDFSAVVCGQWRNTSAITTVTFTDSNSGNFIIGSGFFLYGVW